MKRRAFLMLPLALCALSALPAAAQAQGYPSKPIKYIVPVAPGGGSDMIGRALADRLGKELGQPIVVDNQGGGGGVVASQATARAAPDGYTLMQGYVATHGTAPATRKLSYDALRDHTPIGMIGATPNVLIVEAKFPARDFGEFIDHLRKNPDKVAYGTAGAGSLTHMTAELFLLQTGATMTGAHYRGIAPAITDLIGGQTQTMFPGLAAALPHIRSGRVRALAVTGDRRHPALPDVPTLDEVGLKGFDAQQWYGVVGPANMPGDVVDKINKAMQAVMAQPDFKEKLSAEAVELMPMSPGQFAAYMKQDLERWRRVAADRKIKLDD